MTDTYQTLRAANHARQQEWDTDNQITSAYRGNELAGEMGEALERAADLIALSVSTGRMANVVKKLERERMGIRGSRATVEDLAEELSDIQICTDLVAMDFDIDLDAAVRRKFNATSEKQNLRTRLGGPMKTVAILDHELKAMDSLIMHVRAIALTYKSTDPKYSASLQNWIAMLEDVVERAEQIK